MSIDHMQSSDTKIVIVGGCGHVGLPLGLIFAENGFQVTAFDTSAERVDTARPLVATSMFGNEPSYEDQE